MADTIKETHTCNLTLTLNNGNEMKTRNLSFDIENTALRPDIKDALKEQIIPMLVGGGMSKAIQPTGWRDNDDAEEEWECLQVEAKLITKNELTLDLT